MRVIKRYKQHRRDLWIDTECENCMATKTVKNAYDDHDYWTKWQPQQKCDSCGESTESLGSELGDIHTKYPEGMEV